MAWTNPRDWTAGETVTEAMMDTHVRDNLLHIAGSVGFTATPSTAVGIQPAAGYFAGAALRNYHIEGGGGAIATGGTKYNFVNAFAATPVAVVTPYYTSAVGQYDVQVLAIDSTSVTLAAWQAGSSGFWMAWGSDT